MSVRVIGSSIVEGSLPLRSLRRENQEEPCDALDGAAMAGRQHEVSSRGKFSRQRLVQFEPQHRVFGGGLVN